MLTYPATIPPALAARLDRIIAEAERASAAAAGRPPTIEIYILGGPQESLGVNKSQDEALDADATTLGAAVTSIAAIIAELPNQTRATIDDLIEQVLTRFRQYQSDAPDAFRVQVLKEVHITPWWRAFVSPRESQTPTSATIGFGDWVDSLRLECRWTVEDLADKVKLHRTAVDNHKHDRVQPRPGTIGKYERVFTKALGRPIKWPGQVG